ncbi:MAG: outer membrane protein assembly factor BamA [Sphaerochaetaceae bacterium]|nr:outer membrane protein assembly factor BamA [Sphaerochaetaceae bacterium]MDC7236914.1 outer membrane protein assembly factor BamA [Sphaerochaetaceae bacterium]
MLKKFSLILLISILSLSSVFAADDTWYEGVKISEFQTEGLKNADKNDVSNILFKYRNKVYTEDLFNQLQAELYSLNSFSYFYAEATRINPDSNQLRITLTFFEKQLLDSVTFEGNNKLTDATLLESSGLNLDTFYEGYEMSQAAEKLKQVYSEKGYADIKVTPKLIEDAENNTVSINFQIEEGKQVIISEIEFTGNENFDNKVLSTQLESNTKSLFRNGFYSEATISKDKENLQTFYYDRGYIMATIDEPSQEVLEETDTQKRIKLVFNVFEGEIWTVGKISFEGNTIFSDDFLNEAITLREGDVFNRGLWITELRQISQLYYDKGYINLAVNPQTSVDEENRTVTFTVSINEGSRAKINKIIINGIGSTQEVVYTRELTFKEGEYFNKSAVEQSLLNIQNTQLVTELNYSIDPIDDENCNVIIEITEGGQQDIQFGATFGGTTDEFPISGFATLTDRNIFGTGNDLSTSIILSPSTQKASVSFVDEYFDEIPWSNGFSFSLSHTTVEDVLVKGGDEFYDGHIDDDDYENNAYPLGYSSYAAYVAADEETPDSQYLMDYELYSISAGYDTGYTFRFDPGALIVSTGLNFSINKAIFNSNYLPYEELIYKYSLQWQFSNKLTLGFAWDGRDLKTNTTRGWYVSQNFTYAGGFLGGLSNYNKSVTSFSAFTPVLKWETEEEEIKQIIGSYSTSASFMFPQYYYSDDGAWGWYDAKEGATSSEMLYIDGASIALGHDVEDDLYFLFDNKFSLEYTLVKNILAWDTFVSATAATESYDDIAAFQNWDWYFAAGTGLKIKISGFPIGLYLVKDATLLNSDGDGFEYVEGSLFNFADSDENSIFNGVNLVLSFTSNLF